MIITLTGPNSFLLKNELDNYVDIFLAEYGDMGLERLDGEEVAFERITEAIQGLSFLANKKMVVLHTPGANKQFAEHFEQLIPTISDTTDVMIVEPKLDKRLSYYKALKKYTDFKEFHELAMPQLVQWLTKLTKDKGGELNSRDAQFLVERVGINQQQLFNELNKLLDYEPKVSRENIQLLTEPSAQSTVFELLDAAFNGRAQRTMELYEEQRRQKVEPLAILAMLAWQLHILALLKTAGARTSNQIAHEAKINPYIIGKSQNLAGRLTLLQLKQLINSAYKLDIRLKSESADPDEALQQLLMQISL